MNNKSKIKINKVSTEMKHKHSFAVELFHTTIYPPPPPILYTHSPLAAAPEHLFRTCVRPAS